MKVLVPLAIGCGLVGVVAIVLAIVGWDWMWWVIANGVRHGAAAGAVPRVDDRRGRGPAAGRRARVRGALGRAARPGHAGRRRRHRLEPDPDVAAAARAEDVDTGFAFLWTAAAPAAAVVLAIIFAF